MEDVVDLYEESYESARPLVCFDESPKQLIAEVHELILAEPGVPARYDTEYERKGVCDLMLICEPKRGFRQVDITDKDALRSEVEANVKERNLKAPLSIGVSLHKTLDENCLDFILAF